MNINDLKQKIKNAELSGKKKDVARYILENHIETAFLTASELAKRVGVSEPTVIRFATTLGFSGFPELQSAIQDLCQRELTTLDRLAIPEKIEQEQNPAVQTILTDMENLNDTLNNLSLEKLNKIVEWLIRADKVIVIGMRMSSALAKYFELGIKKSIPDVITITSSTDPYFEELVYSSSRTLVVAICYPRYSTHTVEYIKAARDNGLKTVAITDSELSPLVNFADLFLTARCKALSYIDSFTAPIALIGALSSAVALTKSEETKDKLLALEELWEKYETFF